MGTRAVKISAGSSALNMSSYVRRPWTTAEGPPLKPWGPRWLAGNTGASLGISATARFLYT